MRIARRRQSEVPQILLRIPRLLQRPQHQVAENSLFRFTRNLLRKLLIHSRRDVHFLRHLNLSRALASPIGRPPVSLHLHAMNRQRPHAQRIPERRRDHFEVIDSLRVRLLMNAIQRRDMPRLQMLRHALVRGQHELFNQPVRDITLRARNALHQSRLVKLDHRFRQIEIDGSPPLALTLQNQSQIPHQLEAGDQRRVALAQSRVAFEHGIHRGIRHALSRADHALTQLIAHDFTAMIDLHHARHHQSFHLRTQTANVGR